MKIFNYAGDIDSSEYTCGAIAGIDRYIVKGVILPSKIWEKYSLFGHILFALTQYNPHLKINVIQ